ncbi:NADH:flavin oxidoreductase [Agrobacterium tumefaciens]|uniref:NADH:flavin oxidoreductase n=1 Tax=Agrobacterium tumefaciens TaxID=358 RepID=UPI000B3FA4EC|nr:NADH:flavin oxidoreductase [Agrobacterium tumefaciens]NSY04438.1 NADH:flavin oxidoreductase [Agrobacterium tumefaciens]OVE86867.1 NADH:flavin oxidoreductase [Agrobacterium tumefaciens]
MSASPIFTDFDIKGVHLANRLAVAPMTRISATEDGVPTQRMVDYYQRFAKGGFGLLVTEGIYPDKLYSQGYAYQPGISDDKQAEAWKPVVSAAHEQGAKIFAQLMHAGALSQANIYKDHTVGPSAELPKGEQMGFYRGTGRYPIPSEASEEDIADAISEFALAAKRALNISGFDGIEIHGANGYLLDQFFTDYTNKRTDRWGGNILQRLSLTLAVLKEVKTSVGSKKPVGVRISQGKVNDFFHKWAEGEAGAEAVFGALADAGADYIHVTEFEAWKPAFGDDSQSLVKLARRHAKGVPIIGNGGVTLPSQAEEVLEEGADIVALGKAALANPGWPNQVKAGAEPAPFDFALLQPLAHIKDDELTAA